MNENTQAAAGTTRSGFVALLGATNAGKSTLVNRLVGAKVSIVTHKVQTTRTVIRGIVTRGDAQIVLVDMPGIFRPRRRLDRAMIATAWGGARDADIVVVVVDAERGIAGESRSILEALAAQPRRAVLALNKIDRIRRDRLLELAAQANAIFAFERT